MAKKMRMKQLFELFDKEHLPKLTPRVQRDYRRILQVLTEWFGDKKVKKVTSMDVVEFQASRVGKIHGDRMIMVLSSVFKKAQGRWMIDKRVVNPCIPVERTKKYPRERYITHQEFIEFRATAPISIQLAMDLAYLLGQRQADCIGLKWDQIVTEGPRDTMNNPVTDHDLRQIFTAIGLFQLAGLINTHERAEHVAQLAVRTADCIVLELNKLKAAP